MEKKKEKIRNICIFMESGRTFSFQNIHILENNENMLSFEYLAMSDGNNKRVWFSKFSIIGFSIYEYELK